MADSLNWGVLATGKIAYKFARGVTGSRTGRLVAVGSRSQASADAFGDEFDVPHRHGSYADLLDDDQVEAVYIATPHPMHGEWVLKAAEAGKHILVEKPIGLNRAQAMAMIEHARRHHVFLMEAFMYRCHPQTARLVELVRDGAIGQVRVIQATFSFHSRRDPQSRILNNQLGGGGILDVGCYAASMARLIAGAAAQAGAGGRPASADHADAPPALFAEPTELRALGCVGETGVDDYTAAVAYFPGDVVAQLATGVQVRQENVVRLYGSEGRLFVPQPWQPQREGGAAKMLLHKKGQSEPQTIETASDLPIYGLEADVVASAVASGRLEAAPPAMSWADTLGNMALLDRWREQIGVVYEDERPGRIKPLAGRPPTSAADHPMTYGEVRDLDKPIARLVMGTAKETDPRHAAIMWDDYLERGGNAFDTAWNYGGGQPERLLGQWLETRGLRDKIVILGKGAHHPHCDPHSIRRQLQETLDRLRTDHLDIYCMHRDNLQVPVGEFVDVLDELREAGQLKMFGGSNWTIERLEQANAYAAKHGKAGMTALSNNFSLARMIEPVWKGCIAASNPYSRAWLEKTQTPNFAWSSQARGFFTDRSGPDKRDDPQMVRCWYSEDNFERKRRAVELAKQKGVSPINIAAAYVIDQAFPSFALIGPENLYETTTALPALHVALTAEERRWLDLQT